MRSCDEVPAKDEITRTFVCLLNTAALPPVYSDSLVPVFLCLPAARIDLPDHHDWKQKQYIIIKPAIMHSTFHRDLQKMNDVLGHDSAL